MDRRTRELVFKVTLAAVDDMPPKQQRRLLLVRSDLVKSISSDFAEFLKTNVRQDEVIVGSGPDLAAIVQK